MPVIGGRAVLPGEVRVQAVELQAAAQEEVAERAPFMAREHPDGAAVRERMPVLDDEGEGDHDHDDGDGGGGMEDVLERAIAPDQGDERDR
ncbi:hypothetical protein ABE10_03095 [Bacillus toyonensis]|nr:hypothetical protein [Bacillus toyonensis]